VIGMMRTAALECALLKIRVNTVNPAPIETRMMRSMADREDSRRLIQVHPARSNLIQIWRDQAGLGGI
jgi:NAD(P)-dependent dehydrogenase (short-subunit alcohol dehydrogenase family)